MHADTAQADGIDPKGSGPNPIPLQEEPLITVPISEKHRVDNFVCKNSQRVAGFFGAEAKLLVPLYCRLFIAPRPDDETAVWGYYTLSAALLFKGNLSGRDEKRIDKTFMGSLCQYIELSILLERNHAV